MPKKLKTNLGSYCILCTDQKNLQEICKSLFHIIQNMEKIFMNAENSKSSEPHRFKLDLTDKRNLKNPNKNMALANLSIYYTWKNIKSE